MKLAVVVWHQRLQSLSCRDYCSLYVSLAHQEIYPTPFLALRTLMVLISMLTGATDPKQKGSKAQRRQNFKKSFSTTKALIVFLTEFIFYYSLFLLKEYNLFTWV
jgi:hypothetical protein